MTKKDYIKFAAMLKEHVEDTKEYKTPYEFVRVGIIAHDIADIFQADNPNFNRERFLNACGLSDNS